MSKPTLDQFNLENLKKLDVVLPNGVSLLNIHTDEDEARAQRLIASASALISSPASPTPQASSAPVLRPAKLASKRFGDVVKLYLHEVKISKVNTQKTIDEKISTFDEVQRLYGNEPIEAFTTETISSFKSRLLSEGFSVNRVNKKLSNLRELFRHAIVNSHLIGANPVQDMKIATQKQLKAQTENYEPFTKSELQKIFAPGPYKKFNRNPEYFFCPLVSFYTGARLEEIASLTPQTVVKDEESGIYYLDILKAHAKNIPSIRRIPVSQRLIDTGFLTYLESVKNKPLLFPNLSLTANGYGKNVGARFALYLDQPEVSIIHKTKVFHSFRHTFINRMSEKSVNSALLMAVVGHYAQSKLDLSSAHFKHYQHNKSLEAMKDVVELFDLEIPYINYYQL